MKKKWGAISGGSAVLFGMGLSRRAREHYGINGSLIIAAAGLVIMIAALVIGVCTTKKYLGAMMVFLMLSPLIVSFIGMCLQNFYMIIGGMVFFFVLGGFMNKKVLPKFKDRK